MNHLDRALKYSIAISTLPFGKSGLLEESQIGMDALSLCLTSPYIDCENEKLTKELAEFFEAETVDNQNQENILCLNWNVSTSVKYSLTDSTIKLHALKTGKFANLINMMSFEADDRQKWFLENTHSLGIPFIDSDRHKVGWVATITDSDAGHPKPVIAVSSSSQDPKAIEAKLRKDKKWDFEIGVGDMYAAGGQDVPNDHFIILKSDQKSNNIPDRIKSNSGCVLCNDQETTVEHITPRWLVELLKVKPYTSSLLCKEHNTNLLGDNIEIPISEAYKKGELLSPCNIEKFKFWCVKTALLLSYAEGVRIPESWMQAIGKLKIPENFIVFCADKPAENGTGYSAGISFFNGTRTKKQYYLATFMCSGIQFCVIHLPKDKQTESLKESILQYISASGFVEEVQLHLGLMERMTGNPMKFDATNKVATTSFTSRQ